MKRQIQTEIAPAHADQAADRGKKTRPDHVVLGGATYLVDEGRVDVRNCIITSEELEKLTEFINLEYLRLFGCNVSSSTSAIFQLENLTTLILNYTNLDVIPPTVTSLKCLKVLNLDCNRLEELDEVFVLENLIELSANGNMIYYVAPTITNLTGLQVLSLTHNYLQEIPTEFCKLFNLRTLHLEKNDIVGIPREICDLTDLEELYLNSNDGITTVPRSLFYLENAWKYALVQLTNHAPVDAPAMSWWFSACEYGPSSFFSILCKDLRVLITSYIDAEQFSIKDDIDYEESDDEEPDYDDEDIQYEYHYRWMCSRC